MYFAVGISADTRLINLPFNRNNKRNTSIQLTSFDYCKKLRKLKRMGSANDSTTILKRMGSQNNFTTIWNNLSCNELLGIDKVKNDRETCHQMKNDHFIKTGESWGKAPPSIQTTWKEKNCDELVSVYGQDIFDTSDNKKPIVKLVIYDRVGGYLNWLQDWFVNAARESCSTYCLISHRQNHLHDADIIIYHAPTHSHIVSSTAERGTTQSLHILVSLEQSKYATILNDNDRLNKFDALATYSMKPFYPNTNVTNIPLTYFSLEFMNTSFIMRPPRPFKEKTGYGSDVNVSLFVSNCKNAGASTRYDYLQELMQFINIHSYGRCFHNIDEPKIKDDPLFELIGQRRSQKTKIISNYKFYLSFENDAVEDYVSGT